MIDTILTSLRLPLIRRMGYHPVANCAALRIAVGCAALLGVLLMQSCATQEMETPEKEAVPASNATEERPVQQDNALDVTDSAPERTSFESMYLQRSKTAPDEQK